MVKPIASPTVIANLNYVIVNSVYGKKSYGRGKARTFEEASKDILTLLHHNNQLLSKKEVSEQ